MPEISSPEEQQLNL